MKKNNIIAIIALVVLIIGMSVVSFVGKDSNQSNKTKEYSFDNFNLLPNSIELLSNQKNIDDEIMDKIKSGEYTLDNPLVIVNPYDISPLSAVVGFVTDSKTAITVTLKAKEGGKDLVWTTKDTKIHYIPILGLYMNYNNIVELKLTDGTIISIDLPVDESNYDSFFFPDVVINQNLLKEEDNDFMFLSTPLGPLAAAYDQTGEIRWFLKSGIHKDLTQLSSGHFLLSSPESINNGSLGLLEVDLLGKIYNSYSLEDPYLNNFVELKSGNILYASTTNKIIELDMKKGIVVRQYDIDHILSKIDPEYLTNIKTKFDLKSLSTFNLINSLDYDEKTDSILVGLYHYSTLINLDKKGRINWMLANPEYYSQNFSSLLLKPKDKDFVYPLGVHNSKINNGKLSVMNNGWDLSKTTACANAEGLVSSAREYIVDLKSKTITESWKYETDIFSFTWGDYRTNNEEKLIAFGRDIVTYHAPAQSCKLDEEGDFVSKIVVLSNEEEVFNMTISNSYNFFNKMSILNNNMDFSKTIPKNFTADQPSDKFEEKNYKDNYKAAVINSIPFELAGNQLSALYYEEDYKVVLMDEFGKGFIFKPEENTINVKKGLGKTLILIERGGEIYNTGYYIDL